MFKVYHKIVVAFKCDFYVNAMKLVIFRKVGLFLRFHFLGQVCAIEKAKQPVG